MRIKSVFFPRPALLLVLTVAFANHLLTFLAYDWYAGTDGYSYDACGMQLVSGKVFDLFPILFRPPFTPVVKNILYLLFEGHPYFLSVLIHLLGIFTAALAYDLGRRFHNAVGFILGMLVALNLPMSAQFHQISAFTFFVPLLLLSADCFVIWLQEPGPGLSLLLGLLVSLSFLTRLEALALIPAFAVFGWLCHRRFKPAAVFLCTCIIVYNLASFCYYANFGYWGITYNKGWALFTRVTRAKDSQFSVHNGQASEKVYGYMRRWLPEDISLEKLERAHLLTFTPGVDELDVPPAEVDIFSSPLVQRQMYTLNMAQKDIGYLRSDDLFLKAALEGINSDRYKFAGTTLLRVLGQLDIYYVPGLNHKEYPCETDSGHMWGFEEKRMLRKKIYYDLWKDKISALKSPLEWERQAIKIRLCRLFGLSEENIVIPEYFQLQPNAVFKSGLLQHLGLGDGNMEERFWNSRDLDLYFSFAYWGQRPHSKIALKILKYWDMFFMPRSKIRMNIHRVMWLFWILGIFTLREKWRANALAALLCAVVLYAFCQSIFSDNFGGRFELYMRVFLWLGGIVGILSVAGIKMGSQTR